MGDLRRMRELVEELAVEMERVTIPTLPTKRPWPFGTPKHLSCSFCGRYQTEVKKLVAGPACFICDACTRAAMNIVDEIPGTIPGPGDSGADS